MYGLERLAINIEDLTLELSGHGLYSTAYLELVTP